MKTTYKTQKNKVLKKITEILTAPGIQTSWLRHTDRLAHPEARVCDS